MSQNVRELLANGLRLQAAMEGIDLDSLPGGCVRCRGLGFVTKDVYPGHPDFGIAFPCVCTLAALKARYLQEIRNDSGLFEPGYDEFTFESWVDSGDMQSASQAVLKYAEDPVGWLLLRGEKGAGKTHLAVACGKYQIDHERPAKIVFVPAFLDHLRSSFSPKSDVQFDTVFEEAKSCPFLILDDLGSQKTSPWAEEKLFQLSNHRQVKALPTIITTNLADDELQNRMGSRIRSAKFCTNVPMVPSDRRSIGAR